MTDGPIGEAHVLARDEAGEDAFALYEANWRFVEEDRLQPRERDMIMRLTQVYGHGLMNV